MHPEILAVLRCPLCRGALASDGRSLRCDAGHAFDLARQGYVSFLVGRQPGPLGDDAAMLEARSAILAAGHFEPLSAALASAAAGFAAEGLVVEVGAGTAHHLARVLDALPGRAGLAIDASKAAGRRAARAHPRAAAVLADARGPLPLADRCAGIVLDVFAPRNGPELRRIVAARGALLVATPRPDHLRELRATFGTLEVDPEKARRVESALGPFFERARAEAVEWELALTRGEARALVAMGPTARHVPAAVLEARAAALAEPVRATGACVVEVWRPREG